MADVNYISPSSLMPQLGQVNIPGLQGWMLGNQERDYRDTMETQKFLSGIGAQKSQIGLEELIRDLPKKDAERQRDTQAAWLETMFAPESKNLNMEKARREDRKGNATLESDILSTNAKNRKEASEADIAALEGPLNHVMALRGMLENTDDPTSLARVLDAAKQAGMPEDSPVYKHLATANSPETLKQRLDNMERHLKTKKDSIWAQVYRQDASTQVREAQQDLLMKLGLAKLTSNERNTDVRTGAQVEVARIQAEAKKYAAEKIKGNTIKKLEEQLVQQRQNGDLTGAAETVKLMTGLKQANALPNVGLLLAFTQFGKLPKDQQTPDTLMKMFSGAMEKLNAVELQEIQNFTRGVQGVGGQTPGPQSQIPMGPDREAAIAELTGRTPGEIVNAGLTNPNNEMGPLGSNRVEAGLNRQMGNVGATPDIQIPGQTPSMSIPTPTLATQVPQQTNSPVQYQSGPQAQAQSQPPRPTLGSEFQRYMDEKKKGKK